MRLLQTWPTERPSLELWFSDKDFFDDYADLIKYPHYYYQPYLKKSLRAEVKVKRRDYLLGWGHVVGHYLFLSPFLREDHPEFYAKISDNCIAMIPIPSEHGNFVMAIPKMNDYVITSMDPSTFLPSYTVSAARLPPFGLLTISPEVRPVIVGSDDPATFCGYIRKHKFRGFHLRDITHGQNPDKPDFHYSIEA